MTRIAGKAAITGIGMSAIGRGLERDTLDLTLDAIFEAIGDAGLAVDQIDGLCTMPGYSETPGMAPVPVREVKNALGLKLNWFASLQEGPALMGLIFAAAAAIASGQARHILCYRTMGQFAAARRRPAAPPRAGAPARRVTGWHGWFYPFNALSAAHNAAMIANVRMERFGLTREQLGAVALNARRNAAGNPRAVYRNPMSMDDYLGARMITEPLCLYDCDSLIDGSAAIIVSAADAASETRKPPLAIEAVSGALHGMDSWDQFDDLASMAARDAGKILWERTDLRPKHVDLANLYDGFSIHTLVWLEALGFCGRGESGAFVEGGTAIARGGALPLNTGGGQLSGGRLHGFGLLHESCLQLWGEGGERQVPGDPRVAVTAVGGGSQAGCLLLRR